MWRLCQGPGRIALTDPGMVLDAIRLGGRSSYRFFSSDLLTTPSISFGSLTPPNRPGSWNL